MRDEMLTEVEFLHNTYHHFVGNGSSDSQLDRILCSVANEVLTNIECKLEDLFVDSHHDILCSEWRSNFETPELSATHTSSVPTVPNTRHRVK